MKTTRLLLASALFVSLATLSLAGPGVDHWYRAQKAEQDRAKAKTTPIDNVCAGCSCAAMKKS